MKIESKVCNDMDHSGGVNVSVWEGNVSIDFKTIEGKDVSRRLRPDSAVRLWRFLMGEFGVEEVHVECLSGNMHLAYKDDGFKWIISLLPDLVAELDADQALALAWGIKRCVSEMLVDRQDKNRKNSVTSISISDVWVLTSHIILTGDSTADGSESIGGSSMVFSSAEKARDSLREFMRPLVNEAYSEDRWIESDRSVDDVIDEIIEREQNSGGESTWILDGLNQSFRITLSKKIVDAV